MRTVLAAMVVVATAVSAAACGNAAAPHAGGPTPRPGVTTSVPAVPGPPAGSRAEATALAGRLLSLLRLPADARRLQAVPLPASLGGPAFQPAASANYLDRYLLFAVAQPMKALAGVLAARVPAGLSLAGAGQSGPLGDPTTREVSYTPRSVPAGIWSAQLVLTMASAPSGGSLLRADAEVTWYPARTAAEYIDPTRYHVLIVDVTLATLHGTSMRTIRRVVTSRTVITRLAEVLDGAHVEPATYESCPVAFATYWLGFAVSRHSRPVVVVSAARFGCGGVGITVGGHAQPPLMDKDAVSAIVDQALGLNPQP